MTEFLAMPKGQIVNRIAGKCVRSVVIARPPFGTWIIEVLEIRRCGCSLAAPRSVITARISQALGICVGDLILQAAAEAFLQRGLQCVVAHRSYRRRPGDLRYMRNLQVRISREIWAWRDRPV